MAYQLPSFLVGLSLRSIYGLLNKISRPATFGVHICLGDLNHKALIHPKTLKKMVRFSNELVRKWPSTHRLEYVHYPLAEAADPPPLDGDYYADLRDIKLPDGVRFVAGFVHGKRSDAEHLSILKTIEGFRSEPVEVACSCGMGRYSEEEATELLVAMKKVANAP